MKALSWSAECQRYFIESKTRKTKNGKPQIMPIDVRKLYILGNFIFTDYYIVNLIKRKGERLYCVKQRVKPLRGWWDKTPIKASEYKWNREGTYTREAFLVWLQPRIDNPLAALVELETCPPDNVAA